MELSTNDMHWQHQRDNDNEVIKQICHSHDDTVVARYIQPHVLSIMIWRHLAQYLNNTNDYEDT